MPSSQYRSPTVVDGERGGGRDQFMCMFEIEPNAGPWTLIDHTRVAALSLLQVKLLGRDLMLRRIAAFTMQPGRLTICAVPPIPGGEYHERMSYSLTPFAMRWPDAFACSLCEIKKDALAISVQYENGIQPKPGEKVLVVLGGTFMS